MDIDAFPGRTFRGTVATVSPGAGAQFAILPPQNASGNWAKVVQRVRCASHSHPTKTPKICAPA
jgi:membrane fusion protein (multidrug efflux system)